MTQKSLYKLMSKPKVLFDCFRSCCVCDWRWETATADIYFTMTFMWLMPILLTSSFTPTHIQ